MAADETPGRVAATLTEAKRIADGLGFACRYLGKIPDFTWCGGPAAEAYWEYFHPARIVSLLAAVEAALKLADDWDADAARLDIKADQADRTVPRVRNASAMMSARAQALEGCARALRAITAALTGTPVNDSAPAAAVREDEGP